MFHKKGDVYCKGCKHFQRLTIFDNEYKKCFETKYQDKTFYKAIYVYLRASERNPYNTCPNRIQKPWWMFWRG